MIQSLQGPNIMLVDVSEKLLSFREKFRLWNRTIESQKIASIPVFNQFLEDTEVCFDDVQLVINKHLASLIQEFDYPQKGKRMGMGAQSICFWCWYIAGKLPNYFWISRGIYWHSVRQKTTIYWNKKNSNYQNTSYVEPRFSHLAWQGTVGQLCHWSGAFQTWTPTSSFDRVHVAIGTIQQTQDAASVLWVYGHNSWHTAWPTVMLRFMETRWKTLVLSHESWIKLNFVNNN